MAYKSFTESQRVKIKALVAEMRDLAALWIDTPMAHSEAWETRADMILDCSNDWDVDGCFVPVADFLKSLRETVRHCRRSQADVFAAIRSLGYSVRKTDCGEYRVAKRIKFHASAFDREMAEAGAAYCSDLAEALATAVAWAQDRADQADARKRRDLLNSWETRAAEILAQKRLAYGDSFATAEEAEILQADPLAWLELIAEYAESEIGLDRRGHWADEYAIDRAKAEVAAEQLAQKAESAQMIAQPSPEQIAQLVAAAKSARFALESACYLQGLKALAPAALALTEALAAFEPIEDQAEAQMRAAVLSGRPDLAA